MVDVPGQWPRVNHSSYSAVYWPTELIFTSPYFGQSTWFQFFHKEKHPDVVERYNNEIRRVYGVLESVLAKTEYLVGGKPTIADMAFISWNFVAITRIMPNGELDLEKEFPAVAK